MRRAVPALLFAVSVFSVVAAGEVAVAERLGANDNANVLVRGAVGGQRIAEPEHPITLGSRQPDLTLFANATFLVDVQWWAADAVAVSSANAKSTRFVVDLTGTTPAPPPRAVFSPLCMGRYYWHCVGLSWRVPATVDPAAAALAIAAAREVVTPMRVRVCTYDPRRSPQWSSAPMTQAEADADDERWRTDVQCSVELRLELLSWPLAVPPRMPLRLQHTVRGGIGAAVRELVQVDHSEVFADIAFAIPPGLSLSDVSFEWRWTELSLARAWEKAALLQRMRSYRTADDPLTHATWRVRPDSESPLPVRYQLRACRALRLAMTRDDTTSCEQIEFRIRRISSATPPARSPRPRPARLAPPPSPSSSSASASNSSSNAWLSVASVAVVAVLVGGAIALAIRLQRNERRAAEANRAACAHANAQALVDGGHADGAGAEGRPYGAAPRRSAAMGGAVAAAVVVAEGEADQDPAGYGEGVPSRVVVVMPPPRSGVEDGDDGADDDAAAVPGCVPVRPPGGPVVVTVVRRHHS